MEMGTASARQAAMIAAALGIGKFGPETVSLSLFCSKDLKILCNLPAVGHFLRIIIKTVFDNDKIQGQSSSSRIIR